MPNINMDNMSPTVLKHALNLTPVKFAWLSHGQSLLKVRLDGGGKEREWRGVE